MMDYSDRELLFRLLKVALLEIRGEAYRTKNSTIFHLVNLFHNLPSQMLKADRGEMTDADLLVWLRSQAKEDGIEEWLDHTLANNI